MPFASFSSPISRCHLINLLQRDRTSISTDSRSLIFKVPPNQLTAERSDFPGQSSYITLQVVPPNQLTAERSDLIAACRNSSVTPVPPNQLTAERSDELADRLSVRRATACHLINLLQRDRTRDIIINESDVIKCHLINLLQRDRTWISPRAKEYMSYKCHLINLLQRDRTASAFTWYISCNSCHLINLLQRDRT